MLGVDSASSMMRYSLTALDLEQADQPAPRAFRAVQGRLAHQLPRACSTRFDLVEQTIGLSHPFAADGGLGVSPGLTHARFVMPGLSGHDGYMCADASSVGPAIIFAPRQTPPLAVLECGLGDDFHDAIWLGEAAVAGGRLQSCAGQQRQRAANLRLRTASADEPASGSCRSTRRQTTPTS